MIISRKSHLGSVAAGWPESGWRRRVEPGHRHRRRALRLAPIAVLVVLGIAAIGFNVRTAGGAAGEFVAAVLDILGALVLFGLAVLAVGAIAARRQHSRHRKD